MKRRYRVKLFTVMVIAFLILFVSGCGAIVSPVFDQVEASANQNTVDANLRTISGAIAMYNAENDEYPKSINDLLDKGALLENWFEGPDGVSYELVVMDGSTIGYAFRNNAGNWWTAEEDVVKHPVEW